MARYTSLSPAQIDAILADYALKPREVAPLSGGAANSSYLVHAGSAAYVLTVLDNHDSTSAEHLATLLEHVVDRQVPTGRPVRTRDGAQLAWADGRPVLVKEYMAGQCPRSLSTDQCRTAGAMLGAVHRVEPPRWLRTHGRRLPTDWGTRTDQFLDREFAAWLKAQWQRAHPVEELAGPYGLVHGDCFPDNLVITDRGDLALLDWETATRDLLVLDLGMAIVGLCRTDGHFRPECADNLLHGYETVRRLTDDERRQLPNAVRYASVVIAYHRYLRHHVTHPDPTNQHLYREIPRFVQSLDDHWPAGE